MLALLLVAAVAVMVFAVALAIMALPERGLDPGDAGELPWVAANEEEG